MIFDELKYIMPFENLRDNKQRENYLVCSQSASRVIGMTSAYCGNWKKMNKLRDKSFSFQTVIADDASLLSEIDFISAMSSHQTPNKIKRIIITGDSSH